ncbi:H-2 class I histocompatibility antigen, Q9 alpha chain-like isoform X1 [Alligator sinensis]|uniref:H-2 class I histocompatibility antigen, Q9 alpha chain-like isoform X1 n=1 Tax=Alligator sinensis TaxID=38654 RepID=A0A3Q0FUU0_ALLSI|nr:H-2 class I histocompatibility antigen, Q9 alpha chain-like isoform X1 [Alligator sinensis]
MVPTWPVAEEETEVATTWEELEAAGDAEQAAHGSDPFPGGWCLPRGKKMTTFSGSFLLPAEAQPVSLSPGSNTCKGPPNQDYNTNQEAHESQALGPAHTAPSPSAPQSDPAAPCSPLHPSLCGSTCNSCAQRPEAPHEASAKVAPGSRLLLLLLLLVGIAAVPGIGAGSQSYWYFYMGVSDPGPDMLDFTAVGYMGDQQILHYNSETQRQEPRGNWVQGAVGLDSWNRETRTLQGRQEVFKWNLLALQHHYKQTSGSHTLQFMYGCQLGEDGCTRRYMQFGYDGGDFISYDLGMRTSVAETTQAQVTQRKWNEDKYRLQYLRAYLEGTCIEWLRQYLQHREAILQSSESRCHRPGQH